MHAIDTTFLVQVELREASGHTAASAWLDQVLQTDGPVLALAPQVLTEFIHVVTDPRRFARPLDPVEAVERAQNWWEAREVRPVFPGQEAMRLTLQWLREHRLGRERLLDTQLAATYHAAGITDLSRSNVPTSRPSGYSASRKSGSPQPSGLLFHLPRGHPVQSTL